MSPVIRDAAGAFWRLDAVEPAAAVKGRALDGALAMQLPERLH